MLLEAPLSGESVLPSTLSPHHASAAAATLSAGHKCTAKRHRHGFCSSIVIPDSLRLQTCIGGLECSACMYSAYGISVHIATSYMIIVYYLRDIDDDRDCGR